MARLLLNFFDCLGLNKKTVDARTLGPNMLERISYQLPFCIMKSLWTRSGLHPGSGRISYRWSLDVNNHQSYYVALFVCLIRM